MKFSVRVVIAWLAILLGFGAHAATYSFQNIGFKWDAPSGSATTVGWHANSDTTSCTDFPQGDDDWADISFGNGFVFTLGGTAMSSVRIYSNGILAFGGDNSGFWRAFAEANLPITSGASRTYAGCPNTAPSKLLLVYWDDIVAGTGNGTTGASIVYETLGTAPNRRLVITWNNVKLYNDTIRYNFQVVLYETPSGINGPFEYRYSSGSSTGSSATVGVQLSTSDYTLYGYDQSFIDTSNGTDIYWYPQNTPATSSAVYHFDEASWSGVAGEVIDSSGNSPSLSAKAIGSANTTSTTKCGFGRAGSFPASTSNTVINAVQTPYTPANAGSIDFWYYANSAWNNGTAAVLFDATKVASSPFYLMKTGAGALQFTITSSTGQINNSVSSNQAIAANSWQHIAVTWLFLVGSNQTYVQTFLNGTLINDDRFTTTGTIATLNTLNIGDIRTSGVTPSGASPNSANGLIDEVRIYSKQINSYQVLADMSCTAQVDHFVLQSSGSGLTCAASTVTVQACQNASCSVAYTAGASGTLVATGTAVNWDGTSGGNSGAGFIANSSGLAAKNFQITAAGTTTLSLVSPNPVPSNATVCNFGTNASSNNCVFTGNTAGFIVTGAATGTTAATLGPQVAGVAGASAYLRALQAGTTTTAACTPAIASNTVAVTMGYSCNNPSSCSAGNLLTVNSTSVAPTGSAVSLAFDANGSAPIALRYDDVGQITVNASTSVTPFSSASAVALTGSSNAFVVAPSKFAISGVTAGPIKAGKSFSATVTAQNALSATTPNFGRESTPESVNISFTRYQPTGTKAVNGTLSGSVGGFTSGVASSSNLAWSEVGTIDLSAVLASGSYLGSGLTASGTTGSSGAVGRFIPDHFVSAVTAGCAAGGFTYSGQPFTLVVTAMNGAATPAVTQNYDGSNGTSPNFAKATTWSEVLGLATGALVPTTGASTGFASGVGTFATPAYTFTNVKSVPASIGIRVVDSDGVSSSGYTEGSTTIRSGRLHLLNAYGSPLLPLRVPLRAEYYASGTGWVTNTADSCTSPPASAFTLGSRSPSTLGSAVSSVQTMSNGLWNVVLSKPAAAGGAYLAMNLGAGLTPAGNMCLVSWTNGPDASTGPTPSLTYLTGAWCASPAASVPVSSVKFGSPNAPYVYLRERY